jgi:hypothetical protein
MTRGQLEQSMGQQEFIDWQAFYELEQRDEKKAIEEAKRTQRVR